MGKTFRKNIEFGRTTSTSYVKKYRTHNRAKKSDTLNIATDEFQRGRNYKKTVVAWNPSPHSCRAPGRKGMVQVHAQSARRRREQQLERRHRQWKLIDEECHEDRCESALQDNFEKQPQFTTQEMEAMVEWNTPLIVRAGGEIFKLHDTYTYTLIEDGYSTPSDCLVRKIGDKYCCILSDDLIDYPEIAYNDDLWMVQSIGILLWLWQDNSSQELVLPDKKNESNIQGEFVAW